MIPEERWPSKSGTHSFRKDNGLYLYRGNSALKGLLRRNRASDLILAVGSSIVSDMMLDMMLDKMKSYAETVGD